jgi:uncharacterized membrane protein YbhN (UPF0104 family)
MAIDHVIFSYKLALIGVAIITLMVYIGIIPGGLGIIVASAYAGLAFGRELAWRQKSG